MWVCGCCGHLKENSVTYNESCVTCGNHVVWVSEKQYGLLNKPPQVLFYGGERDIGNENSTNSGEIYESKY